MTPDTVPFDPRTYFSGFYTNPTVLSLAHHERWTISGQLGQADEGRKAPIDIQHLLKGCSSWCQHPGPVRGARFTDGRALVSLDKLTDSIPQAMNAAFYLQSHIDQVMIIDIEPYCPPAVRDALLALPGILYAERSMSGHGHHLITRVPSNLDDFPIAAQKRVLAHQSKWYELLFEHWITFTRSDQPLPGTTAVNDKASREQGPFPESKFTSIEDLYEHLAAFATANHTAGGLLSGTIEADLDDIEDAQELITAAIDNAAPRLKCLDDFDNDNSRWEFSILATLYFAFLPLLKERATLDGEILDDGQLALLLAGAAAQVLPHRDKHDTTRNGRPFLLERAVAMVAGQRARAIERAQNHQA